MSHPHRRKEPWRLLKDHEAPVKVSTENRDVNVFTFCLGGASFYSRASRWLVRQKLKRTMVGGGSHTDWHVHVCMCFVCVCVCVLVPVRVCFPGCVLEQVSLVDVPLLGWTLWALGARCYWTAGGAASCYGREIKSREGRMSCLWKIWSAQVCERHCGPGVMWTGRSACLGIQRRELLGLITVRPLERK